MQTVFINSGLINGFYILVTQKKTQFAVTMTAFLLLSNSKPDNPKDSSTNSPFLEEKNNVLLKLIHQAIATTSMC